MTVDELLARESIRHTMARYSLAGDEFDAEEYISCFTDDAVLEFKDFPGRGDIQFKGKQAIHEFVSGFFGAVKSGQAPIPGEFMRHHLTTCRIDLIDENTAKAKTYCLEFNINGAEHSGIYTDEFSRVGEEWKFSFRRYSPDK